MPFFDSGATYDSGARYDDLITTTRNRMKHKVALGLSLLNPAQTVQLGQDIHTAMTGNAHFTDPTPELTELQTRLTAATTKINAHSAAIDALNLAIIARDNALQDLRDTLSALGLYVENISGGDEEIIASAGMPTRAVPTPVTMTQVQNLRLIPSDKDGELRAFWDRVLGVRVYEVQVSTDTATPPNNWQDKLTTTKSRAHLNDTLVSGQKVWVRVRAIGPNDEGAWSDPAWKTVP
jgi:hypothetical protein